MSRSASVVALSVVAALATAWFWFRSNEVTISSPPETRTREPEVQATETAAVVLSVPAVEDNATRPQTSPVATQDERGASEAKKISDAVERGVTPAFVDYLTSKGASREDSERIVADAMREMASCVRDALPAEKPGEAAPAEVKAGNPTVMLSGFFSGPVGSCMESVHQRIGLPPKVTYDLRMQGETVEFGAHVLPE